MTEWVAGVDGCPGGWLVVLRPLYNAADARARLVKTFAEVLEIEPSPAIIGVDMPIGLPDISGRGGRPADVAARANLGGRQSAVFAVPSRAAVMEADYARACDVAFATSEPPRKVSKQCFHLFSKIREIDSLMSPAVQARVYECHPEVGFWALNGEQPLPLPKKVKSRPSAPGLDLRRRLLDAAGYDQSFLTGRAGFAARDVGPDDLLDAAACAWTAARIRQGNARRFPGDPGCDAKGLRMEIWG
jgi:predicted RNase H-like nuclease